MIVESTGRDTPMEVRKGKKKKETSDICTHGLIILLAVTSQLKIEKLEYY